jgi:hypothetical protein
MLEYLLGYTARGFKVFPLVPGAKTPLTKHGFLEASGAEDQIRSWWTAWPRAGVGIATGAVSNLVVLDVDIAKGGPESLVELQRRIGVLPDTPEVITHSGGRHLFFRYPGHPIQNAAGLLGPGLDLRGDGGYVCAPPTIGPSGREYVWDLGTVDLPLAAFPSALTGRTGAPWTIQRAAPIPDRIPQGQRESILTSLAGSMRRRGAQPRAIEAALAVENLRCDPPLSIQALRRIATSMGRYDPQRTARGGFSI